MRYQISGKRRELGLGTFPSVSLREARERAAEVRARVRKGVDPLAVETPPVSFLQAAARHIRRHRRGWSRRYTKQWVRDFRRHAC